MEDNDLNERAIKGEEAAFLALLQLHKKALLQTAFAFLKTEHEALEALQEVTYRAFIKIHTVREPAFVKTWLIRIMINYCQDRLKKINREFSDHGISEATFTQNELHFELAEALSALSKEEQQLIYLKYFQGVKVKEIAQLEKIPEGTVKSRLHKTLKTLRRHFGERGEIDHV